MSEQVIKCVNCTLLYSSPSSTEALPKNPQSPFGKIPLSRKLRRQVRLARLFSQPKTLSRKRLNRFTEELAERGAKTEQQHDHAHSPSRESDLANRRQVKRLLPIVSHFSMLAGCCIPTAWGYLGRNQRPPLEAQLGQRWPNVIVWYARLTKRTTFFDE